MMLNNTIKHGPVMDTTDTKKLLCIWHVDRAWRNKLSLIKNKDKQSVVYKTLCIIREEQNKHTFDNLLGYFIQTIRKDAETKDFGVYFEQNYANRVHTWAYFNRKDCMINTNMHLESMHKVIKYIYLKGRVAKRLDKTIHILMKFARDKQFEQIIKLTKGKCTKKHTAIHSRHLTALHGNMTISKTNDCLQNSWVICSDKKQYMVKKLMIENHSCRLSCGDCEACIHIFSCSCEDYFLRSLICKHIHFVCINMDANITGTEILDNEEINFHTAELRRHQKNNIKETLKKQLAELNTRIEEIEDEEVLMETSKKLKDVSLFLKIQKTSFKSIAVNTGSSNKKLEKQIRFYSTKKKQSTKTQIGKPKKQEKECITEALLGSKF